MTKLFAFNAEWQYQTTSNTVPADPAAEIVPAASWLGPSRAPFGTIGDLITDRGIATAWALDTGLWIRRNVVLDGKAPVLLSGRIENACYIYFDGEYIGAVNPSGSSSRSDTPEWFVIIPQETAGAGTHEIALLCQDEPGTTGGDTTYVYVEAEYLPALFPLWPRAPMSETLEWVTDVNLSEDGSEDRGQMRVNPRQSLDMSFFVPLSLQPLVTNKLYGNRTRQWLVPFWPHVQLLGAVDAGDWSITVPTPYADFRDYSLLLLWQDPLKWQVLGIDRVTDANTIAITQPTVALDKAYVMPLRRGFLSRTPERRFTGHNASLQLSFTIEDNAALMVSAPTQYLSNDIYTEPGLLDGSRSTEEMVGRLDLFDEDLGRVSYSGSWLFNRPLRTHRMMGDGLEEAWDIREWLHRRAGRYRAFWQPTFEADLKVTSTGALTTALSVRSDDYIRHAGDRSHIAVETAAGWLAREITNAVQISEDVVQLTLSSSLVIDASAILRVSFLGLRRLDADRVEIEWIGGQVCSVSVPTVEIQP
jgi:hypothetical protein